MAIFHNSDHISDSSNPRSEPTEDNHGVKKKEISFFSKDRKLDKLLNTVVTEVKLYAEAQIKHIRRGADIGRALSAESDINKILEMILDEARTMTGADAGTLYILDNDLHSLRFKILQNDTMGIRMGGTGNLENELPNAPFTLPNVPLYKEGKENHSNVSSHAALTGETINIPDVYHVPIEYEAKGFDFTGPRNYDASTGYRSRSMLVIPLKNNENEIIGVLQLLNAKDTETEEVIPFSSEYVDLIASLASQAAVALTNTRLIQDLKKAVQTISDLFNAFIKSIAIAVEKKSQSTGGHIERVVELTMMIAEKINKSNDGTLKGTCFSYDEMEELRLAAWMHDVGKITTPEYVIDKATKLQTVFDRMNLVETRFELIAQQIENEYLRRKIEILEEGRMLSPRYHETEIYLKNQLSEKIKVLRDELDFIRHWNSTGDFMNSENIKIMKDISDKTYLLHNKEYKYLSENETENLIVQKGNLTREEREKIENHAKMTLEILSQLPFPNNLKNVPKYASQHHERLDGSGYFEGLKKDELSLQSRIIAVADIFEALTAPDRPYKKPMKLSQAIRILESMKKDNHIDPDIYNLFIQSGLHIEYAKKRMKPEQIDEI